MRSCLRETQRENTCYPGFYIAPSVKAEWVNIPFMIYLTTAAIEKAIPIGFHSVKMVDPSLVPALRLRLRQ